MHARHHTTGTSGTLTALKPRTGNPHPRRVVRPGPFEVARNEQGRATADMRSAMLTAAIAVYPVFAAAAAVLMVLTARGLA